MAPLRPVLRRILADVQERLTFRAQAFIKVSHKAKLGNRRFPSVLQWERMIFLKTLCFDVQHLLCLL